MKILILLLLLPFSAHSSSELKAMFTSSFDSHYVSGRCGDNIVGLLQRANLERYNLNNAKILEITNYGFSVFGMVNVEYARKSGPHGAPGERNWYHHVVLEKDGLIYDFDYGNTPKVLSVESYFEKMFLKEKKKSEGGEFYVGREEKLKSYKLLVRPGLEILKAKEARQSYPEGETFRLGEYLNSFAR